MNMRFEFEYEIGEIHEESFEAYFPEFDQLEDIAIEHLAKMEKGNKLYKTARKNVDRADVLNGCLSHGSFKIVEKEGIKIEKPIIYFDLETTGTDVVKDQIVQVAITKIYVGGKKEKKVRYLKPTIPIPKEASDIHGIDAETVKNAPSFKEVAKSLRSFIDGCDVAGYNSTAFDVPLLQESFIRAGVMDWPEVGTRFVDAMMIFHHFNPRTLSAAYKHYCDKDLEGAHDADNDIQATIEILDSQIAIHDIPDTVEGLHAFCNESRVDFAGKLKRREDGGIVYTFGKHRGKLVSEERGFAEWMLSNNFPHNTKACVREILYPAKVEATENEATK